MAVTITAVYEDGVLRPLEPLHLKNHQVVEVQIRFEESDQADRAAAFVRFMALQPEAHDPLPSSWSDIEEIIMSRFDDETP